MVYLGCRRAKGSLVEKFIRVTEENGHRRTVMHDWPYGGCCVVAEMYGGVITEETAAFTTITIIKGKDTCREASEAKIIVKEAITKSHTDT